MSDANFVQPETALSTPRAAGLDTSQKAHTRKHGMIASFVFEFEAYCVNGYAAHANASTAPSLCPPKRSPTNHSPRIVRRSKRIAVTCAVGRSSHFPLQPVMRYAGMYASYAVGPYVSPSGFARSHAPFVWIRISVSVFEHVFGSPLRLTVSCGKFPHGACPWTIRSAPITPA